MKPHQARRRVLPLVMGGLLLLSGCGATAPKRAADSGPLVYPPPPEPARYMHLRTIYGTHNVEEITREESLRALLTGSTGKQGLPFSKPFDVAVHNGRVFVTDTVRFEIFAFDLVEKRTFQFGRKGDESDVGKPLGIAADAKGWVYVVDNRHKRVVVYDRDGKYLYAFGGKEFMDRPTGIDVDPEGKRAYVVDVGGVGSEKHQIHVFDIEKREFLFDIATRGKDEGQLNLPRDVSIGPDGLLYVTDGGNFRIQVFTQDGKFVRTWGKAGMRYGNFSRPKGIATDAQGLVYAVDAAFGNFQIFDQEGTLLLFIGTRNEKDGPGIFMLPAGIDIDEKGYIYVIDQFFRKLEIFRPVKEGENTTAASKG
ncbi:MAG: hypothetical protein Kow006_09850 [Gammaproteobacteria bacterium]